MTEQNKDAGQSSSEKTNEIPDWFREYVESQKSNSQQSSNSSQNNSSSESHGQRGYGGDILNALNALPEKIVNAMREQNPSSDVSKTGGEKTNESTSTEEGSTSTEEGKEKKTEEKAQSETTIPGRKSFGQWWFS